MTVRRVPKYVKELLRKKKRGIRLDVGCGFNKQKGYIGLDIRKIKTTDILHDAEVVPYPLPRESCSTILASHLIEHICPKKFMSVMEEWHNLLEPDGQLLIATPYGKSYGFYQDPTHCNHCVEATWQYFDPSYPLYNVYKPKPWKLERAVWWDQGNMEVIMSKVPEKRRSK